MCALTEVLGKGLQYKEACLACSLSPLIVPPEILMEAVVSLVPEEVDVVLPGDKSSQTLPFASEGTVLLSEALALQGRMCPSDSHCVIVGDSSQLSSGSGCGLYFLLDRPAELCRITVETDQIKVTGLNSWVLLPPDLTIP